MLWSREKSLALPGIEPQSSNSYHFVIPVDLSRLLAAVYAERNYYQHFTERESFQRFRDLSGFLLPFWEVISYDTEPCYDLNERVFKQIFSLIRPPPLFGASVCGNV
jgi:hypothetical protein